MRGSDVAGHWIETGVERDIIVRRVKARVVEEVESADLKLQAQSFVQFRILVQGGRSLARTLLRQNSLLTGKNTGNLAVSGVTLSR